LFSAQNGGGPDNRKRGFAVNNLSRRKLARSLPRSKGKFVAKLGVVVEEPDETAFWMDLLVESGIARGEQVSHILKEANELLAIFAASQRTARAAMSSMRQ
jgi:hypothetical protein